MHKGRTQSQKLTTVRSPLESALLPHKTVRTRACKAKNRAIFAGGSAQKSTGGLYGGRLPGGVRFVFRSSSVPSSLAAMRERIVDTTNIGKGTLIGLQRHQ